MNAPIRSLSFALIAGCLVASAHAQRVNELRTVAVALETPVKSIVFPVSNTSPLVMPECASCPPKSFPLTADSKFFIGKSEVTVQEMRAAVIDQPELLLTVKYTVEKGELVSVTADITAPRVAPRR